MTLPKGPDRRSHIKGEQHHSWRGGRQQAGNGAVYAVAHGHPLADSRGRVYEHVLMAEKALGHLLPKDAVVHHIDEDRTHNENVNFVICENQAYHLFLHRRLRAYRACGHADWYQCRYCRQWGSKDSMYTKERQHDGPIAHHRQCHSQAEAARRSGR